ncbi:MAG: tyrosine-type recombinase/integrase [Candidatus Xenobia bacterium]
MKVITPQELAQLLAAVDLRDPFGPRDHAMLRLCANTGLRVSELAGLNHHEVAHSGQPRETLFVPNGIAKGGKHRIVPLNTPARQAIQHLLHFNQVRGFSTAPTAPLLVNRKHHRLSSRDIQRLAKALREKAGLAVPATPHSLRHLFASSVASTTGNLKVVQQLIGHQRLSSTEVYLHPTRDELAAAVARLE